MNRDAILQSVTKALLAASFAMMIAMSSLHAKLVMLLQVFSDGVSSTWSLVPLSEAEMLASLGAD